jgi:hypothetical protein
MLKARKRAFEYEKAVGGTRSRSMQSQPSEMEDPSNSKALDKLLTLQDWLETRPAEQKLVQDADKWSEKGQVQRDQVLNAYFQHFEHLLSSARQPTTEAGLQALLEKLKV